MSNISTSFSAAFHQAYQPNPITGDIMPPLHLSTTFLYGNQAGYDYSRSGNPNRQQLEQTLASLDQAQYGLTYSSGSAALVNVVSLLKADEAILFSSDAYGGTYRYIVNVAAAQGVQYAIADLTDGDQVKAAFDRHRIKIVWVETPTNPLLRVTDIATLSQLAHHNGAWVVVDNTFATPVLQQPIVHGADMVAYSPTKYINGHSDSIGGALTLNDTKLYERLKFLQNAIGSVLSPFDSWLTLRGLRTLELRMQRHVANAQLIAQELQGHPKIKHLYYPGLFTGEQGRIVQQQMQGAGGIISLEIADGLDVQKFIHSLRLFPLAESLGGVESLLDHPASMTHAAIPVAERKKIGLSDGLLRLSIGIEAGDELLADLLQALEKT